MKPKWIPPKGVTQLTYNVCFEDIKRLEYLTNAAKTRKEEFLQTIVRVKCGKQSDTNYKKWDIGNSVIVNFNHKGTHVYMQLSHIQRVFAANFGIGYKLLVFTIKELPK